MAFEAVRLATKYMWREPFVRPALRLRLHSQRAVYQVHPERARAGALPPPTGMTVPARGSVNRGTRERRARYADPEHASPERQRREGSPGVENTGKTTVAEFVRIRNARKSSEFSRIRLRKSFTALPFRALRICGFTAWDVARGSCRVAVPQADLFLPFGAMPESSCPSKGFRQNPVARMSAG
jgi:hypothetical protein